MTKKYIDDLTYSIIGAAIEVQKSIGQGLLENTYHRCLAREFELQNLKFQSELTIPIQYKGIELNADLRCDFLVENCIVVELKAIDAILKIHEAQLLTYMKLLSAPKGILINFNSFNLFKDGQQTYVNTLYRTLPES
jgi:GxxExxY protein